MFTIWIVYFIAAMAVSGMFVAAGWRSKHVRGMAAANGGYGLPTDPLWGDAEIDINAPEARADVAGAVRLALRRLAPVMASRCVQVEVAAPTGLLGRMRPAILADLMEEFVATAIHNAPGGRLLLTAATYGDRIYIGISDDRPGADPEARTSNARNLMERVALRGGSLNIDVRPDEGTTMTLRLSAVPEERPERKDRTLPEPSIETAMRSGATVHR